ncbi:unnamed protein product [Mytilus coruscus]|uniref:Exonuclease domain-containing protein n=1 Tax=Mytilus coruscus TaxID=42192 RepID=A0A6J8C0C1_MYTCO|nr:unnamed protein product [Mytilus coruscus]
MGYASLLFIRCECAQVNQIETSETHVHGKRDPQVYDVNTKAALAMIDFGIGVRHLARLMTIMGVPGSSERTMKKRERELFKPMVDVARDSCHEAITKECSETRIATPGKGLSVKYDMCWQKRGSGRSYSSSSGVGTEKKEGITYKSGLSLSLVTEDKEIPGIKQKPALLPFSSFTGSCILFDLETSSLKLDSEILQIAALNTVSGDTFDTYIQPNKSIAPSSSAITGLTANGNILLYNGKPVHAVTSEAAFQSFVLCVESIAEKMKDDKIVKDDAESFGDLVREKYMSAHSDGSFGKCVSGFADALPLFRQKFPGLNSYSQQKLFEHFCNEQYNAHNAVDDVDSLHKLMTFSKVEKQDILEFSFSVESIAEKMKDDKIVKDDAESFGDLVKGKYMSAHSDGCKMCPIRS